MRNGKKKKKTTDWKPKDELKQTYASLCQITSILKFFFGTKNIGETRQCP